MIGSVLGPLLFFIYVDDLTCVPLSAGTEADDILLFHLIHGMEGSSSSYSGTSQPLKDGLVQIYILEFC